jgi:hypothetical protein
MPRGQATKRRPGGFPAKGTPPSVPYEQVMRSIQYTLDEEINKKGGEARAEILNNMEGNLATVQALATGIKVQQPLATDKGFVCNRCGSPVTEVVYTVPPFWPALRWLGEWARQLVKEEPNKGRVVHELSPETIAALRTRIFDETPDVPLLPERNADGVVNLHDEVSVDWHDDNEDPS